MENLTQIITRYLESIRLARSPNTATTYRNALNNFDRVLRLHNINPDETAATGLPEEAIVWLANDLRYHAPATERLYITAVTGLYEFMAADNLAQVNLPRIHLLVRQRARRPGIRLPQFPKSSIERILDVLLNMHLAESKDDQEQLITLRDRAFLITLADTGLRVHEACGLRRGDIDWNEGRAVIIGKGNRQAIVRFSQRSMDALKGYLIARANLDGSAHRPLGSLPLFARHDKGAGKKVKPITPTTGRNIVAGRVLDILGPEAAGTITPHSFRHYFVTRVLQSSGNLKLAQELARHRNIAVTQRYAHLTDDELDKGYWDIFSDDK